MGKLFCIKIENNQALHFEPKIQFRNSVRCLFWGPFSMKISEGPFRV